LPAQTHFSSDRDVLDADIGDREVLSARDFLDRLA
jgi:hypothetical protein